MGVPHTPAPPPTPNLPELKARQRRHEWECKALNHTVCFRGLLTVNCGPVMKGSGNGVTVSAGNVFIFKIKKKEEGRKTRVTSRLDNEVQ